MKDVEFFACLFFSIFWALLWITGLFEDGAIISSIFIAAMYVILSIEGGS